MQLIIQLFLFISFLSDIFAQNVTTETRSTPSANKACSLVVLGKNTKQKFDEKFNMKDTMMLKVQFSFENASKGVFAGLANTDIFLPLAWTKTKKPEGRGLLLLKEELISFPFSTLSYGVENFAVDITESPPNCFFLENLNVTHLQTMLMNLVLGNLDSTNKDESPNGQSACNQHIKDNGKGVAEFDYVCCQKDDNGEVSCSELSEDVWLTLFFHVMVFISVIVVLYSPLLVPEHWYREKYTNLVYKHELKEQFKLKILISAKPPTDVNIRSEKIIILKDIKDDPDIPIFKEKIDKLEENHVYTIAISKLLFKIKADRLVSANYAPVGVFKTLYDTIVHCQVRQRYAVRDCCNSNMFGTFKPCQKTVQWHECLQKLMLLCILPVFAAPWILRIYFYYVYEDIQRTQKTAAAGSKNLAPDYPGNLLAYLNPVHGLFVFCYAVLAIDALLFGILRKKLTERSRYIIRQCFRDMRGTNRSKAFGYSIFTLLIPIKKFGIFSLFVAWIYWLIAFPVLLLVIVFYFMPMVNIICRLLFTFLETILPLQKCFLPLVDAYHRLYKEEFSFPMPIFVEDHPGTPKKPILASDKVLDMLITLLLIISLVSFTTLALEFLIVFVEYILYQLVGLVLNWGPLSALVGLALISVLYAIRCFRSVTKKYLAFNEKLIPYLKSKAGKDIESVEKKTPNEQGNCAFQIDENSDSKYNLQLSVQNSHLQWNMPRVVLFLDKTDRTYITEKFFFKASKMPNAGCPGSLMANLFSAFCDFIVILLFLLFVLLVIVAFGDKYEVSHINQAIFAAAAGILPYVFDKILFKKRPDFELDTTSPKFKNALDELVDDHIEHAFVYDIEPADEIKESSDQSQVDLLILTAEKKERASLLLAHIV